MSSPEQNGSNVVFEDHPSRPDTQIVHLNNNWTVAEFLDSVENLHSNVTNVVVDVSHQKAVPIGVLALAGKPKVREIFKKQLIIVGADALTDNMIAVITKIARVKTIRKCKTMNEANGLLSESEA